MKKALLMCIFVTIFLVATPSVSFAADSGLEVESVLDTVLNLLGGRVAWFVGVGSIIVAAAGWAASEGGSIARGGFKLMMVLAVMFNAAKIARALYKASEGLGIL